MGVNWGDSGENIETLKKSGNTKICIEKSLHGEERNKLKLLKEGVIWRNDE